MKVRYGFKIHSENKKNILGESFQLHGILIMNVLNINYAKITLTRQINKLPKLRHATKN